MKANKITIFTPTTEDFASLMSTMSRIYPSLDAPGWAYSRVMELINCSHWTTANELLSAVADLNLFKQKPIRFPKVRTEINAIRLETPSGTAILIETDRVTVVFDRTSETADSIPYRRLFPVFKMEVV